MDDRGHGFVVLAEHLGVMTRNGRLPAFGATVLDTIYLDRLDAHIAAAEWMEAQEDPGFRWESAAVFGDVVEAYRNSDQVVRVRRLPIRPVAAESRE